MSESENFSDFEINNEFMLLFYKKIEIDVCEILNLIISVWSSLIIINKVWTTLKIKIVKFIIYMILWLTK